MIRRSSVLVVVFVVSAAGTVNASPIGVGEMMGTFGIRITHGGDVIVDNPSVAVPTDTKLSDGDPEGFVQIGTVGGGRDPVILKIVTGDDPGFRTSHWYIDVPKSLFEIDTPGPTSLFDPENAGFIDVEVTGLSFAGTTEVTPLLVNNATYATAYMRDKGGVFYNMPMGITSGFPGPATQVQVPGEAFFDADPGLYAFDGSYAAPTASWAWRMLPNPGRDMTTNNGVDPNAPSIGEGYVFELGLGVSFVGVPEPGTLCLMAVGLLPVLQRQRRRQRRR